MSANGVSDILSIFTAFSGTICFAMAVDERSKAGTTTNKFRLLFKCLMCTATCSKLSGNKVSGILSICTAFSGTISFAIIIGGRSKSWTASNSDVNALCTRQLLAKGFVLIFKGNTGTAMAVEDRSFVGIAGNNFNESLCNVL